MDTPTRHRRLGPLWARASVLVGAMGLAACVVPACTCGGPALLSDRPNVLLIVMDTARADRCGFNGYGRPTTPELDAFARDAVVFRQAWSPSPVTSPSHATLFTGLEPEEHGLVDGLSDWLRPDSETLARRFRAAGYATAAFSNNPWVSDTTGLLQGFEKTELMFEREVPYPSARPTHDLALAWIEERRSLQQPFFLFVNDIEPHLPYTPTMRAQALFVRPWVDETALRWARAFKFPERGAVNFRLKSLTDSEIDLLSHLYDGEMATLDEEIGAFLGALRTGGVLDDTVVVVIGDHGESLGEHGLVGHMLSVYGNVLHVPLLIRFPGRFDGGRTEDRIVRTADIAPTVLELCGLPAPAKIQGVSLTRDLDGRIARGVFPRPDNLFAAVRREFPHVATSPWEHDLRSVREGRWHLIVRSDGKAELYDVSADPLEERDLARSAPAELARLMELIR